MFPSIETDCSFVSSRIENTRQMRCVECAGLTSAPDWEGWRGATAVAERRVPLTAYPSEGDTFIRGVQTLLKFELFLSPKTNARQVG